MLLFIVKYICYQSNTIIVRNNCYINKTIQQLPTISIGKENRTIL
jgi:hypothetical protein